MAASAAAVGGEAAAGVPGAGLGKPAGATDVKGTAAARRMLTTIGLTRSLREGGGYASAFLGKGRQHGVVHVGAVQQRRRARQAGR